MARARAWLTLALLVAPALSGCLSDLERVPLDTGWEAQARLSSGPVALVDDRPAQLVVEGPLSIDQAVPVDLTGIEALIETPNATVELTPVRLSLDEATRDAEAAATENARLSDGSQARLTLVPSDGRDVPLPGERWNLSAELQYRYRDGDSFDAGRFTVETNLTVERAPSLGVGVARTNATGVTALVFEDKAQQAPTRGSATVTVYHVGSNAMTQETNRTATLHRGEGVAIAALDEPVAPVEGEGYQLFRLETTTTQGVAVQSDEPAEQPLPAPGALVALAGLVLVAWIARRRPR